MTGRTFQKVGFINMLQIFVCIRIVGKSVLDVLFFIYGFWTSAFVWIRSMRTSALGAGWLQPPCEDICTWCGLIGTALWGHLHLVRVNWNRVMRTSALGERWLEPHYEDICTWCGLIATALWGHLHLVRVDCNRLVRTSAPSACFWYLRVLRFMRVFDICVIFF